MDRKEVVVEEKDFIDIQGILEVEADIPQKIENVNSTAGAKFDVKAIIGVKSYEVLSRIAKSGRCPYHWKQLMLLIQRVFLQLVKRYQAETGTPATVLGDSFQICVSRIENGIVAFQHPPWTLQRICEILIDPTRTCKDTRVFIVSCSKLICGIRERMSKGDVFGLASTGTETELTTETSGDTKKPAFQFPFYNAPRLRTIEDPPVVAFNPTPNMSLSESVALGFATVRPGAQVPELISSNSETSKSSEH